MRQETWNWKSKSYL